MTEQEPDGTSQPSARPGTDPGGPRRLTDTSALATDMAGERGGVLWKLDGAPRDLDANVIRLAPHGAVAIHAGPDVDVLVHVLDGSGALVTPTARLALAAGALVWLPRASDRGLDAGAEGLTYLTVHQRRQALRLAPPSWSPTTRP